MKELNDYSGEFNPNLRLEEFSKEALIKMWLAASKMYIGIEGLWRAAVEERFGSEVAEQVSHDVWFARGGCKMEATIPSRAMGIRGHDVASFFKHLQVDPGTAGIMDIELDLKNSNSGILTVRQCKALQHFERHNMTDVQKHVCEELDGEGFEVGAQQFNPNIKARALRLPPRDKPTDIACQWEFKLEA